MRKFSSASAASTSAVNRCTSPTCRIRLWRTLVMSRLNYIIASDATSRFTSTSPCGGLCWVKYRLFPVSTFVVFSRRFHFRRTGKQPVDTELKELQRDRRWWVCLFNTAHFESWNFLVYLPVDWCWYYSRAIIREAPCRRGRRFFLRFVNNVFSPLLNGSSWIRITLTVWYTSSSSVCHNFQDTEIIPEWCHHPNTAMYFTNHYLLGESIWHLKWTWSLPLAGASNAQSVCCCLPCY